MKEDNHIMIRLIAVYNDGYQSYLKEYVEVYSGVGFDKNKQLAKSAAVVAEVLKMQDEEGLKSRLVYDALEEAILTNKIQISGMKKVNYQNYRRIVSEARNKGVTRLIKVAKLGNNNAAKFKQDNELIAWLYWLRVGNGRNLSNEAIKRIVRHNCLINEKTIPSDSWIGQQLSDGQFKSLTAARWDKGNRHGQRYNSILHSARCCNANSRWEMDGTRVNLLPWTENGKSLFLYIIMVQDNHSGMIVGRHYTTSESPENRWAYIAALKDAVNKTNVVPAELAIDRFPGHDSQEWQNLQAELEKLGTTARYYHRAEGKQHIERTIGTLQTVFLSQSDYYYGQGVKSSVQAAHVTTSHLKTATKQLKKQGLGFEQIMAEAERFINQYNTTKMTEYGRRTMARLPYSPAELYEMSEINNGFSVAFWQIANLFWSKKEISLRNRSIQMEVMHEKCIYHITEYEALKRLETEKKAKVYYDELDLDTVHIMSVVNGEFICTLTRQNIVVTRGVEANGSVIGKYRANQNQLNEKAAAEIDKKLKALDETRVIAYWGKEASYRTEEQLVGVGFDEPVAYQKKHKKKEDKDIYDMDGW